jgi:uroporphyrinogen decarboxylase
MTGKERILKTLRFEEPDRPPHFEIMFELEKEAFGLQFPERDSWHGMSLPEKERAIGLCMTIYEKIIERYQWDALAVFWPWSDPDGVKAAKRTFGDDILIGGIVGDSIWSIENISDWTEFAIMLMEQPKEIHRIAAQKMDSAIEKFKRLIDAGSDFIHIVNDVAFNAGPFVSPAQFSEFITPYLKKQVQYLKAQNVIPFVHSDGNIDSILDDYLSLGAACFQSVDPMAGMDIAETKKRCCGRMALMGNVQCSFLQDGPKEAIRKSAQYCLENASPGGGYIFSTSNTIFPGMPLENYEYMLDIYREFNSRKP